MNLNTSIIIHAIPAYILLVIAEAIYLIKHEKPFRVNRAFLASWGLGLGFVLLSPLTKGLLLLTTTLAYEHRLFELPQNAWQVWLLCFLADDFTYYWYHRLSHEKRLT